MIIYKIINLINQKIYIGKTEQTLEKRWKKHLVNSDKRKTPLYLAIKKYGIENFSIEQIDAASSKKELNEKEKFWIAQLCSQNKDIGYNVSSGGDGGKQSDEILKIIGEKVSLINKGKKRSEQAKQNITEGCKGRKLSEETKQKIKNTCLEKGLKPPINKMYGSEHPMFGKTHTKEAKDKISQARLGKTYEQIFGYEKSIVQKQSQRDKWTKDKNPLYKEFNKNKFIQILIDIPEIFDKDLANLMGVSSTYIYNKVKLEFGMSLKEIRNKISVKDFSFLK